MKVIVFATNNEHKLSEVRQILSGMFEVKSLKEIGCFEELPETHETLHENAVQKAEYVKEHYGYDCFADDTGLEVATLNGKPGVYSARYASISEGDWKAKDGDHDSEQNMKKLLHMLNGKENRSAQFKTVIAWLVGNEKHLFEGIVTGDITKERHGAEGFGYDPIFQPTGYDVTFAEMSAEEKNSISHRGRAIQKLMEFLNK
ncbi:MAG: non-canonical purine NTP diphosphatase [Prevotella sp.]|nr:non-canonical purine NTP diphosphatase [Candidatus Prevotella equi]